MVFRCPTQDFRIQNASVSFYNLYLGFFFFASTLKVVLDLKDTGIWGLLKILLISLNIDINGISSLVVDLVFWLHWGFFSFSFDSITHLNTKDFLNT